MRIVRAADRAFLVVFDDAITREAGVGVRALHAWLAAEPLDGQVDLHPAYASLLVRFDPVATDPEPLERDLSARVAHLAGRTAAPGRTIEIPVRYGGEDGPDLAEVAAASGLTEPEVIAMHAGATYEVRFLGFSPGFPYLVGLPPVLATPRRATPRIRVAAGSVAIGGAQTGIYPLASPGGWNVIGRTRLALFDPAREDPALLAPGDVVRFRVESGSA